MSKVKSIFVTDQIYAAGGEDRVRAYITKGGYAGKFKCIECPHLDFACSANVRAHVEYHHFSPGYTCKNCNKTYKVRTVLVKHLKKCNGPIPGYDMSWTGGQF